MSMKHVFVLETDGKHKMTTPQFKRVLRVLEAVGHDICPTNHINCSNVNQPNDGGLIVPNSDKHGAEFHIPA